MKKYIPRNTGYCYNRLTVNECCKNLIFTGIRTEFYTWDRKEEHPFKIPIYQCRYTGTEPIDACKDCDVGHPKYNDYDLN